ncbi:DUF4232 domain-containing protein [Streptomyces sp. NPDC059524]|uniref:DUF4232 domain-containing protein n=1 Tax=Streptomyces sp. NPDC059524 TaxID=3346856 RepID=UPI0036AA0358
MKHTRVTALAAITVAATLSLTACNSDGSGHGSSSRKGSSSSGHSSTNDDAKPADDTTSTGGAQASNPKTDADDNTSSNTGNGTANSGTGTRKTPICKTEDLAIDAADAAPDQTEGRIDITMVNRGSTTCSATGFAGVDIKDADHTTSPIERGNAQPRITVLKPGDAAVFNLAYTIDNTGNSLASPTHILVTPPNETHTVTLNWPANAGDIKGAYTDVQVYPTHTTE